MYGDKVWLSVGPLSQSQVEMYRPYVKGFVASVETVNASLHATVCPSKPLAPYERFLSLLQEMGIPSAITIIVGLGESEEDIAVTREFISRYGVSKLHLYGLIPTPGTSFASSVAPDVTYQARWISALRESFPALDIQCGIWKDRTEYVGPLLQAGANSISKLSALRLFGSSVACAIEDEAREAGFDFVGTLTAYPDVDWDARVDALPFDEAFREQVRKKLQIYLKQMRKGAL